MSGGALVFRRSESSLIAWQSHTQTRSITPRCLRSRYRLTTLNPQPCRWSSSCLGPRRPRTKAKWGSLCQCMSGVWTTKEQNSSKRLRSATSALAERSFWTLNTAWNVEISLGFPATDGKLGFASSGPAIRITRSQRPSSVWNPILARGKTFWRVCLWNSTGNKGMLFGPSTKF